MRLKISAICLVLALAGANATRAHSPVIDADFDDWCFTTDIRPQDSWAVLTCALGTEVAWFDGENDNLIVNDFNVLGTTFDATYLYFVATLYNDPDPASIPSAQVVLDVVPGGGTEWVDVENKLSAPFVGRNATIVSEADYNLVFDFANFLIGSPDSAELRVYDPDFDPNGCPAPVGPADCVRNGWRFLRYLQPAIDPGQPGGSGGPPGGIELRIPWTAFVCDGCPAFGPGDGFRFTYMVAQGDVALPLFTPGGPIEDNISEVLAGTYTTTPTSCAIPGTQCELDDTSSDGYVPAGPAAGDVQNLIMDRAGDLRLSWDPSCIADNSDYAIYEGSIGDFSSYSSATCTTAGSTSTVLSGTGDNLFFLVVPKSGESARATEGSYGTDSAGTQRPPATVACGLQIAAECPAGP